MTGSRIPDLVALQLLTAVQSEGSFSAAGALIGMSQQAVSSRIRSLEERVGTPLFTRSPRGAVLTSEGALICEWAQEVLDAAERLDVGIRSLRDEQARRLRVAASQTIAGHLLPQWLVALRRQEEASGSPLTAVELSVGNSRWTAEAVRSGQADLGFIETPLLPLDLASTTVSDDELIVVTAPDHAWSRRSSSLTAAELAQTPLVTREEGSGTRDALESALASRVPDVDLPSPAIELATSAAVRSAIAAGIAPGVLSRRAVRDDLVLGRLVAIPVDDLPLHRPLSAIWIRNATSPIPRARDLIAIAQSGGATPFGSSARARDPR
jgi:DNA-binding transcriptional LysR family regulator